ncbi:hypothetical protein RI129_006819 [Pyrocoelia pectoralis]|uniref:C3H1-type domain-containing protein n=1 Tax=Pyrocoelia pectoralis TaxID=417401 RepID=A0AAN7VFX1_9COLE
MSLVADYGDSSVTEDDGSDSDFAEVNNSPTESQDIKEVTVLKLPTPDFIDLPNTSVFTNPFKQAEEAKHAILEKHVKMVSTQENVRSINGRKVCWNYRKGKCRFGHNCIYAHDSDVQKINDIEVQQTVLCQSQDFSAEETDPNNTVSRAKKRPGLTQGLVPGKKIMKNYHKQSTMLMNKK